MGKKWAFLMLLGVFLLATGVRLYFNLKAQSFSDSESYYVLRQAHQIREKPVPEFYDRLSYGGKHAPLLPAYYYIVAGAGLMGDFFSQKLFPALLASALAFVAYFIGMEISGQPSVSVLVAYFSVLVPSFFRQTVNTLAPHGYVMLLFFLCFLLYIRIEKGSRSARGWLIFCVALLALSSKFAVLLILVLWLHKLLLWLESGKRVWTGLDFLLLLTLIVVLVNQVVFFRAGFEGGAGALLSAIPQGVLRAQLGGLNWVSIIIGINLVVLIPGVYGIYLGFSNKGKATETSILLGLGIVVALMGISRQLSLEQVNSLLGVGLSLASGFTFANIFAYLRKLRLASLRGLGIVAVAGLMVVPALGAGLYEGFSAISAQYPNEEIRALVWLRVYARGEGAVLAPVDTGHLVSHFAGLKNIADTNFANSNDLERRLADIRNAYITPYETEAISLFDFYGVKYILTSPRILGQFGIQRVAYLENEDCFERIYSQGSEVYEVKCHLR